jgi:histidine triad (HIT) family protein
MIRYYSQLVDAARKGYVLLQSHRSKPFPDSIRRVSGALAAVGYWPRRSERSALARTSTALLASAPGPTRRPHLALLQYQAMPSAIDTFRARSDTSQCSNQNDNDDGTEQNSGHTTHRNNPKCIFCQILDDQIPSSQVYEDHVCRIIMDINPIRPGHVLIIPRRHYQNIIDMPEDVAVHMMKLAHQMTATLTCTPDSSALPSPQEDRGFECHGTNLLWNNGRAAWQTVLHAHLHVIPRQRGDSLSFVVGLLRHFLSLLGVCPPAKRQELDRLASTFNKALCKHVKAS